MVRVSRRNLLVGAVLSGSTLSLSGCGTLLYPERRGQPKGQLDWSVVLLDGIGLLLFLVPGIIAFAVDFGTGAIYLPPEAAPGYSGTPAPAGTEFTELRLPKDQLTDEQIAALVSARMGQPVDLSEGRCHRRPLRSLTQFWSVRDQLTAELNLRHASEPEILRAQSR